MLELKNIRREAELTQQQVADNIGILRASYANIENGKRCPSTEIAKRIANTFGFDWTLFFPDKNQSIKIL